MKYVNLLPYVIEIIHPDGDTFKYLTPCKNPPSKADQIPEPVDGVVYIAHNNHAKTLNRQDVVTAASRMRSETVEAIYTRDDQPIGIRGVAKLSFV